MAKRILGVPSTTADAAVRGELGWWTLKGRRDMLRLRYWGKLTRMPSKRWTRRIYAKSRQQFEKGEVHIHAQAPSRPGLGGSVEVRRNG